jgi:hypothetical protein
MPGVVCEPTAPGAPLRCAIAPALRIGQADVGWFVIGAPQFDLARRAARAQDNAAQCDVGGHGGLVARNDLGDTTVQCALTDERSRRARSRGPYSATAIATPPCACVRSNSPRRADLHAGRHQANTPIASTASCVAITCSTRSHRDARMRASVTPIAIPAKRGALHARTKVVSVEAGRATEGIDPADLRSLEEAADWPAPTAATVNARPAGSDVAVVEPALAVPRLNTVSVSSTLPAESESCCASFA